MVLITGDGITAEEIEPFCPGIRAAVVKSSVSRFAADSMHPDQAREVIRDAAHEAVQSLPHAAVPAIELPATLTVRFRNADLAEMATWIKGGTRRRVDRPPHRRRPDPPVPQLRRRGHAHPGHRRVATTMQAAGGGVLSWPDPLSAATTLASSKLTADPR
ncbi:MULTISPECIES: M55 family metallopeptidase [unclassified Streptomyces]|uniref:M55 family metallopeptidase n=1 Tax=unclassified Streptomyces TaxID=2593676 RepID=UPI0037F5B11C